MATTRRMVAKATTWFTATPEMIWSPEAPTTTVSMETKAMTLFTAAVVKTLFGVVRGTTPLPADWATTPSTVKVAMILCMAGTATIASTVARDQITSGVEKAATLYMAAALLTVSVVATTMTRFTVSTDPIRSMAATEMTSSTPDMAMIL